ncbi:MAG: malonyl-CoA decarboxylase [Pseudomonadota bacterium]
MPTGLINDFFSRITDAGRSLIGPSAPDLTLLEEALELLGSIGEASSVARARIFLDRYLTASDAYRRAFLVDAAERLGPDRAALETAMTRYQKSGSEADARALHFLSEPRSQELIRRLNRAPGGTRDLVAMRNDLLRWQRDEPSLKGLDEDFRHLLASWFNRGFLQIERIDWDTPASTLEKIIRYEAVHLISGWEDLRHRVGAPDRRLYAFFHPAFPGEPLIFVEVALTDRIPEAIGPILVTERPQVDPAQAKTAVFYSISNCQSGLRGINFGNFLIKQVVEELSREFPGLTTFVTLSPVPGLRDWAAGEAANPDGLLTEQQREAVAMLSPADLYMDVEAAAGAAETLGRIAARYLVEAKRLDSLPIDPVARFHLGNGARLERVNLSADLSARGLSNAWGVMVNYLYDLHDIERNHEAYAKTGEVAHAPPVRRLLRQG